MTVEPGDKSIPVALPVGPLYWKSNRFLTRLSKYTPPFFMKHKRVNIDKGGEPLLTSRFPGSASSSPFLYRLLKLFGVNRLFKPTLLLIPRFIYGLWSLVESGWSKIVQDARFWQNVSCLLQLFNELGVVLYLANVSCLCFVESLSARSSWEGYPSQRQLLCE